MARLDRAIHAFLSFFRHCERAERKRSNPEPDLKPTSTGDTNPHCSLVMPAKAGIHDFLFPFCQIPLYTSLMKEISDAKDPLSTGSVLPDATDRKRDAEAAIARIRALAHEAKLGPFDWEEWKAYRDEGRR